MGVEELRCNISSLIPFTTPSTMPECLVANLSHGLHMKDLHPMIALASIDIVAKTVPSSYPRLPWRG